MQISLVIILLIAVAAIAVAVTLFVMKTARKKQADKIIREAEQEGENIKKENLKASTSVTSTRRTPRFNSRRIS